MCIDIDIDRYWVCVYYMWVSVYKRINPFYYLYNNNYYYNYFYFYPLSKFYLVDTEWECWMDTATHHHHHQLQLYGYDEDDNSYKRKYKREREKNERGENLFPVSIHLNMYLATTVRSSVRPSKNYTNYHNSKLSWIERNNINKIKWDMKNLVVFCWCCWCVVFESSWIEIEILSIYLSYSYSFLLYLFIIVVIFPTNNKL